MAKVSLLSMHTNHHIACARHCFMRSSILYLLIAVCVCLCVCRCVLRRAGWLTSGTYSPINFTWAPYHQPQMPIDT